MVGKNKKHESLVEIQSHSRGMTIQISQPKANTTFFFNFFLFFFFLIFWPGSAACEILVPQAGIKPVPPALEVWSLNHWPARAVHR